MLQTMREEGLRVSKQYPNIDISWGWRLCSTNSLAAKSSSLDLCLPVRIRVYEKSSETSSSSSANASASASASEETVIAETTVVAVKLEYGKGKKASLLELSLKGIVPALVEPTLFDANTRKRGTQESHVKAYFHNLKLDAEKYGDRRRYEFSHSFTKEEIDQMVEAGQHTFKDRQQAALEEKVKLLESTNRNILSDLEEAESKLKDMVSQDDFDKVKNKLEKAENDLEKQKEENTKLKKEATTAKKAFEGRIAKLQENIKALEEDVKNRDDEIAQLMLAVQKMKQERARLIKMSTDMGPNLPVQSSTGGRNVGGVAKGGEGKGKRGKAIVLAKTAGGGKKGEGKKGGGKGGGHKRKGG